MRASDFQPRLSSLPHTESHGRPVERERERKALRSAMFPTVAVAASAATASVTATKPSIVTAKPVAASLLPLSVVFARAAPCKTGMRARVRSAVRRRARAVNAMTRPISLISRPLRGPVGGTRHCCCGKKQLVHLRLPRTSSLAVLLARAFMATRLN